MLKFNVKLVLVLKCAALSSCILLPEQMNLPSGWNMLMYSESLQCRVEWVPAWFLEEQRFHMATRISGVRVARRVCRQDYAADSTSSSAERDLWQILYSGVILLCVMVVLGNIREKWSASSQGWEGGWVWFNPRIWFNPIPRESDSGEGAASCYFLSVHLPPSTALDYSCGLSLAIFILLPLFSTPWFLLSLLYNISFSQPQENADKKLYSP